jgi:hypothetical protein
MSSLRRLVGTTLAALTIATVVAPAAGAATTTVSPNAGRTSVSSGTTTAKVSTPDRRHPKRCHTVIIHHRHKTVCR